MHNNIKWQLDQGIIPPLALQHDDMHHTHRSLRFYDIIDKQDQMVSLTGTRAFLKDANEASQCSISAATFNQNGQDLSQCETTTQFWMKFSHKLFDHSETISKRKYNELRAERMAKNANPLHLLLTASNTSKTLYYQSSKPTYHMHQHQKLSLPTSILMKPTRYKGKEIAKPITPPSESASEEDSDPEQAQKDKDMQKNLALIAKYFKKLYKPTNNNLRTSSNTRNKNVDTTPRYKNDNQTGQLGIRGQKRHAENQKWVKTLRITRNEMVAGVNTS
ncbi:hypothetical protein Tco_1329549 [Tanacetum coccineum]